MTDKTHFDPSYGKPPPAPHEGSKAQKPFTYHGGGGIAAKPMTFLGMYFDAKEAQKLWSIMIQNLTNAMNKDQAKALKAIKKLRANADDQDS